MTERKNEELKKTIVTLISNGSFDIYSDNSLTSFSNKLHKPLLLNPSHYSYVALQEIGISLNSSNVKIPIEKPSLIYFQWNIDILSAYYPDLFFDLSNDDEVKELFYHAYNSKKEALFKNYPNKFGVYSIKTVLEDKFYSASSLVDKLKTYENLYSNEKLRLTFGFVEDHTVKFYLKQKFGSKTIIPSFLKQFTIKCDLINNYESL